MRRFVAPTRIYAPHAFGLVLVEAMACGPPVIACRLHSPAAIVADGGTGWLIRPDHEDPLVNALLTAARGEEERRARWPTRSDRQPPIWLGGDRSSPRVPAREAARLLSQAAGCAGAARLTGGRLTPFRS